MKYLEKFAKAVTRKVVYGVYAEGPLRGFKNGDRSYKMEIKPGVNLGSYHAIDGQKVNLKYPGQLQTCARCHRTAQECRGKGVAKRCEAKGGMKVEFTDYILDLWAKSGYSPEVDSLDNLVDDNDAAVEPVCQEGGAFTPVKAATNPEKYKGVSIKPFPGDLDHGAIIEFLVQSGLPRDKKDNVNINNHGTATIKGLKNNVCLDLIKNIHGKKNFERKLFCNGLIPLTPEKAVNSSNGTELDNVREPLPPSPSTNSSKETEL